MKKISIIIPCHNSSEWLENCWNSLKNQSIGISELECIFVDDASEDEGKTWSLLERLELLEDLKDREDEYLKYREEISFHFYFSYYYETLRFSAININAQLPLEYFRTMQKKIKIEVENIKDNCFYLTIKDKSIHEKVIETIDIKFNTTDELMAHIKKIFS